MAARNGFTCSSEQGYDLDVAMNERTPEHCQLAVQEPFSRENTVGCDGHRRIEQTSPRR